MHGISSFTQNNLLLNIIIHKNVIPLYDIIAKTSVMNFHKVMLFWTSDFLNSYS